MDLTSEIAVNALEVAELWFGDRGRRSELCLLDLSNPLRDLLNTILEFTIWRELCHWVVTGDLECIIRMPLGIESRPKMRELQGDRL
ncbi:hypothetical protein LINPERPRIM_LOCUS9057 [Linum perenne]